MGREITSDKAADLAGIARTTWLSYSSRGQAPKPVRHIGRTPVWDEAEVKAWVANRPGQGARGTDRALRRAAERTSAAGDGG